MSEHQMQILSGLGVAGGIAIGRAVCIEEPEDEVLRFQLDRDQVEAELERLGRAGASAFTELKKARDKMDLLLGEEMAGILEAQALLLRDDSFIGRVRDSIRERQVNAEWAVLHTCEELESRFAEVETEYLRERSEDLRNVCRYLLQSLQGIAHHELSEIEGDIVIIGRELTPSDALRFARDKVVGFALEAGGRTTHTTIIARGMNLPMVVKVAGVRQLLTDRDPVIVDGEEGKLILHPTPEVLARYRGRRHEIWRQEADFSLSRAVRPRTADGVEVELQANLELLNEVPDALRFGCTGVGLYRTEFFFIEKSPSLPTEAEHYELFCQLLRAMGQLPVTIRTFDLGGRKWSREMLPEGEEDNPALGLRGIRVHRFRPDILRAQLRALYRAGVLGDLRIMVPLVTTVDETEEFHSLCEEVVDELRREGLEHAPSLPLGAMIEVPAAALVAGHIAKRLDFLSIGTNDLIQYALAVDRNNEQVADLYEPTHPAVLSLLRSVVEGAGEGSPCELSICGEMAADPLLTPLLLGLGLRCFSMNPRSVPRIKERVRSLRHEELQETVARCLELATGREVRDYLLARHPLPSRRPGRAAPGLGEGVKEA